MTTSTGLSSLFARLSKTSLRTIIIASVSVGVAAFGVHFISAHWPYRYHNVQPLLQRVFASQIKIDQYHSTYFPNPGFVATGLTLRRNSAPDLPPLGSAGSLVVQGRWLDLLLFRKRVYLVDVEGLHVVIPAAGSRANREDFPPGSSADFSGPTTVVEQFNIHNAILDLMRADGDRYSFRIRQLVIRNLQKGRAISYALDMENAVPVGHIQASGSFGPLLADNLGATPTSGKFTFAPVDLSSTHGISGMMSAEGRFDGSLAAIEADVRTETPDFAVGRGRPTHVSASAHGTVNGLNANIIIHTIQAHTGSTTVHAKGSIVGSPKATNLDIDVVNGRAQDLLRPFLHDEAPVTGAVWLHSHAYLAPAGDGLKFLQRLRMDGMFEIPAERLTNRATEQKLSAFSERAQGLASSKIEASAGDGDSTATSDVLSSLSGRAKIDNGVVSTRRMEFHIPGATVDLNGTFNFHDRAVHMLGDLRMESDISHVTTGFKSMLMKPLAPFFKKNNAGAVIPIAITGTPRRYKISENVFHQK